MKDCADLGDAKDASEIADRMKSASHDLDIADESFEDSTNVKPFLDLHNDIYSLRSCRIISILKMDRYRQQFT